MSRTYNLILTNRCKQEGCKHELENKGCYHGNKWEYKCKWCTYKEYTDETKTAKKKRIQKDKDEYKDRQDISSSSDDFYQGRDDFNDDGENLPFKYTKED